MNFHTVCLTLASFLSAACFSFQKPFSALYYKAADLLGHFVFVSKNIFLVILYLQRFQILKWRKVYVGHM